MVWVAGTQGGRRRTGEGEAAVESTGVGIDGVGGGAGDGPAGGNRASGIGSARVKTTETVFSRAEARPLGMSGGSKI